MKRLGHGAKNKGEKWQPMATYRTGFQIRSLEDSGAGEKDVLHGDKEVITSSGSPNCKVTSHRTKCMVKTERHRSVLSGNHSLLSDQRSLRY